MRGAPEKPPGAPTMDVRFGALASAAFALVVVAGLATALEGRAPAAGGGAVIALLAGAAVFFGRGRHSLLPIALAAIGIATLANGAPANLAWFGVCLLAGWVALVRGPRLGVLAWAAAVALFVGEWFATVEDPGWAAWGAGATLTVSAGLLVRHQMRLVEEMRRLQVDLARRSRAEERTQIARELHDVIAHSLTVTLLHVSAARLAVEHDPADASRALAEAERLTRQTLSDVRVTVGMLHPPGNPGVASPAPSLGDLPSLVGTLSDAGSNVTLTIEGDLSDIPATTGTSAYRIVQESLTNATKHAPGSEVCVRVQGMSDTVEIAIWSAGPPRVGAGMGLRNMDERAAVVGGVLEAGPANPGWLVHASLPRLESTEESGT